MKKTSNKVSGRRNLESTKKNILSCWQLYVLLLPGLIWYLMFAYKPMIGLRMAFYDYDVYGGFANSTFVGLENFKTYVLGPDFWRTIKNTLMIAVWQMLVCFPFPIILAIMITEMRSKAISKTVQTVTFLPHFISTVVVCGMVISFLSPSTGIINKIIELLGGDAKYFMVHPQYFRPVYTLMTLWQTAGFNAIVYIAALMGIDPQLYEAAVVDGAGRFRRIWNITIPSIIPTIVTMFIMNIGKMVKVGYESILLLYQPSTYPAADVISTYSYRVGIQNFEFGVATAAGLFEAVVALILVVSANKVSKKLTETTLW